MVDQVMKSSPNEPSFNTPNSLLGISVSLWNEIFFNQLMKRLKEEDYQGKIVLGGPQITATPKGQLTKYYPDADIFVRGEGEDAMVEIVRAQNEKEWEDIEGVVVKNGKADAGRIAQSCLRTPSPFASNVIAPSPFLRWETSRKGISFPDDRISKEIEWFCTGERVKVVKAISITDMNFNRVHCFDEKSSFHSEDARAENILHELINQHYRGKVYAHWALPLSHSSLTAFKQVTRLGLKLHISFCLGSIHPTERLQVAGGLLGDSICQFVGESLSRLASTFSAIEATGIRYKIGINYGMPLQTVQSFKETVDWVKENAPGATISALPVMCLRGSPLTELSLVSTSTPNVPFTSSTLSPTTPLSPPLSSTIASFSLPPSPLAPTHATADQGDNPSALSVSRSHPEDVPLVPLPHIPVPPSPCPPPPPSSSAPYSEAVSSASCCNSSAPFPHHHRPIFRCGRSSHPLLGKLKCPPHVFYMLETSTMKEKEWEEMSDIALELLSWNCDMEEKEKVFEKMGEAELSFREPLQIPFGNGWSNDD